MGFGIKCKCGFEKVNVDFKKEIRVLKSKCGESKPAFGKPAFEKPAFEKSAFEKPAFEKPAFGKPGFEKRALVYGKVKCGDGSKHTCGF